MGVGAKTFSQTTCREKVKVGDLYQVPLFEVRGIPQKKGRKVIGVRGNGGQQENTTLIINSARLTWGHRD